VHWVKELKAFFLLFLPLKEVIVVTGKGEWDLSFPLLSSSETQVRRVYIPPPPPLFPDRN